MTTLTPTHGASADATEARSRGRIAAPGVERPVGPRRRSRVGPHSGSRSPGRSRWLLRGLVVLTAPPVALVLVLTAGIVHHIYFDRSGLPDLDAFLRFEPETTGEIRDDRDGVLIELAREYRRVVSYEQIPLILRDAILAAEDKNFFSHSGVEYRALPRVIQRTVTSSLAAWWSGDGFRPLFPRAARRSPNNSCAVTFSAI